MAQSVARGPVGNFALIYFTLNCLYRECWQHSLQRAARQRAKFLLKPRIFDVFIFKTTAISASPIAPGDDPAFPIIAPR